MQDEAERWAGATWWGALRPWQGFGLDPQATGATEVGGAGDCRHGSVPSWVRGEGGEQEEAESPAEQPL